MNMKSTKNATKKTDKPTKINAPTFKSLVASLYKEGKPRGLKVTKNDVGGYTFSYGPKSAPVAIVASVDEVVSAGLAALGLKLSS